MTAQSRIEAFGPKYVENLSAPIWERVTVTLTHEKKQIIGKGKNKEEAAASALAKIKQNA